MTIDYPSDNYGRVRFNAHTANTYIAKNVNLIKGRQVYRFITGYLANRKKGPGWDQLRTFTLITAKNPHGAKRFRVERVALLVEKNQAQGLVKELKIGEIKAVQEILPAPSPLTSAGKFKNGYDWDELVKLGPFYKLSDLAEIPVDQCQAGNPNVCLFPDIGNYTVALKVPVIIKHKRGRKVILALDSDHPEAEFPVQETMLLALARAHAWPHRIRQNRHRHPTDQ